MFIEIDKNEALLQKYSKYQIVNIAFMLLIKEKKEKERHNKNVILTDLLTNVIYKLANNQYSDEEINVVIEEEENL